MPDTPDLQRPRPVELAARLMYLGAALTVIGALPTILGLTSRDGRDRVADGLRKAGEPATESAIDQGVAVTLAVLLMITVISAGMWLWMARTNSEGLPWARIVATVLGVASLLVLPVGTNRSGGGAWLVTLNLLQVLLAAIIVILLWRAESSAFFRAVGQRREQARQDAARAAARPSASS